MQSGDELSHGSSIYIPASYSYFDKETLGLSLKETTDILPRAVCSFRLEEKGDKRRRRRIYDLDDAKLPAKACDSAWRINLGFPVRQYG